MSMLSRCVMRYSLYKINLWKLLIFVSPIIFSILPSGKLAGFPIKYIFAGFVLVLFLTKLSSINGVFLKHMAGVSVFLTLQLFHGYSEFGKMAISEFLLASGAILIGMILVHLFEVYKWGLHELCMVYKVVVIFSLLFKAVIIASYYYIGNYQDFIDVFLTEYVSFFGAGFMTMQLPMNMIRVFIQTDLVVALFPLVLLMSKRECCFNYINRILVVISSIVVILGFSRYNMLVSGLALSIYFYRDRDIFWIKFVFLFLIFIAALAFSDELIEFVKLRFLSPQNTASDAIRYNQAGALWNLFDQNYWFGGGFGAYSKEVIRSFSSPFSYEQQMLSLLAKWGVIGFAIFVFYIFYIIYFGAIKKGYLYVLFLLLFLLASLFNPYLFSSNMVMIYMTLYYILFYEVSVHDQSFQKK
ncbi:O-antigen ligase family protein [Cobetia sp. L2A1]|uniref:O-antigen ligase family protein n=1 Tax=Cobetia sp. L2A1 TaxID=2686360 RepID=UPI00131DCB72|nr:O-antigen ligase family protein [Cobetia sp. L2A1]